MRIPSNKVADIFRFAHAELGALYAEKEVESMMFLFCNEFLGWSKAITLSNREQNINQSDLLRFHHAIKALKQGKPVQYIIGSAFFYDSNFEVNEHTLIPRPETEELAALIINQNSTKAGMSVLDIGTGSGCIAVTLAKHLSEAKVIAIDVSVEALDVARKNAGAQNVDVDCQQEDIFYPTKTISGKKFDIIVSNPPYVCDSEKALMRDRKSVV